MSSAAPVHLLDVNVLIALCDAPHRFWPDAVSLVQAGTLHPAHLPGHRQPTDAYLLALAVHHGGRLVTLDGGVAIEMVNGATPAHWLRLLP
ncbi:MAG: hypothetical protein EP306_02420 [Burkholderiales bacterium]|nr:MAG: hypothetical protein EP306_02420 [Burkholderiales bacterium]